jgi:hypothetical protein
MRLFGKVPLQRSPFNDTTAGKQHAIYQQLTVLRDQERHCCCLLQFFSVHNIYSKTFPFMFCLPCPQDATAPSGPGPPQYRGFTIAYRHTTLGRTPLDEWLARRRDLYRTTYNTHKRQNSGFGIRTRNAAIDRPQHALDRAATGICFMCCLF